MTKEEFLSMVNTELENLEKEYQSTSQRVEYFRATKSRELHEAEYKLKMVQQKINVLKSFLTLPAYARIQAMSDAEIEEYKKGKIEELDLKIKEIQAREEQEKATLSQLKAEQDQLISQFGSLYGYERDSAILRGQQLSAQINRYDVNNQYGVFARLKQEIDEVRKQQEQIKAMTSQEIKQKLSSEMKESHDLVKEIERAEEPIDAYTELMAEVASDPEKRGQMAYLLMCHRRTINEISQFKGSRLYLGYGLPIALEIRLKQETYYYNSSTGEVNKPDKLMEIVQEFEGSFEQAKKSFNEQFTEQKLSKLVGRGYGFDVDMVFLQQHTDKLGDGELAFLQSLVEQRDKLSKKIFKTRDTKYEIESLNIRIKQEQSKIYEKIIGWYKSQSKGILGIDRDVDFYSLEALQDSLKKCKEEIGRSEQAITEFKERIQKLKEEIERHKQELETVKTTIEQQIREIVGEKHKEIDIPYGFESREDNEKSIENAQMRAFHKFYQRDVIDRVQQEAQNQADIREAELRGITVEQLLQMRKQQAQAMTDESMVENEEDSHGIFR